MSECVCACDATLNDMNLNKPLSLPLSVWMVMQEMLISRKEAAREEIRGTSEAKKGGTRARERLLVEVNEGSHACGAREE